MSDEIRYYLSTMLNHINNVEDSIFVFNLRNLDELINSTGVLSVKVVSDEVVDFVLAEDIYVIYAKEDLNNYKLQDILDRIPMISGSHVIPVDKNVDAIISTLYSLYRHRNMKITMFVNNENDYGFLKNYPFLNIIKLEKFGGNTSDDDYTFKRGWYYHAE